MAEAKAELEVLVEIRDAIGNLQKVGSEAQKQQSAMEKSFGAIKVAAAAAFAVLAGKQVLDFFSEGIDAAAKQQTAMANLKRQLELTGESSQAALGDFAAFADQMEKTTSLGDDQVISLIGIAKSFGVTNDEAKKMVQAATELSAATGKDLEGSLRTLGKSLTGTLGPLDDQIAAMKGLTRAQLESGVQFDLIIERYGGSAAAEINTFTGAITQSKNAWGNLAEAFGSVIVDSPVVVQAIKELTNILGVMEEWVKNNQTAMREFVAGALNALLATMGAGSEMVGAFARSLGGLMNLLTEAAGNAAALLSMLPGQEEFEGVAQKIADFQLSSGDMFASIDQGAKDVDQSIAEMAERIGAAATKHEDATRTIETASNRRREAYDKEAKAAAKAFVGPPDLTPKEKADRERRWVAERAVSGAGPMPSQEQRKAADAYQKQLTDDQDASRKAMFGTIGSIVGAGSGRQAAEQAGQMLGAAVADAFVPGLGQAVGPILGVLMQGPEATKQFIRDFIGAIPDIVEAIAESTPVVVEALVDTLVNEGGAERIGLAIIRGSFEAIPKAIGKALGIELGNQFNASQIPATLRNAFSFGRNQLDQFNSNFNQSLTRLQNSIFDAPASIKLGVAQAITDLGAGVETGVTNALTSIGDTIDEAARSLAIPRPGWLDEFLDAMNPGKSSAKGKISAGYKKVTGDSDGNPLNGFGLTGDSGMSATDALLSEILTVLREGKNVNVTLNVAGKKFADLILDLNRRGARLLP